MRFLACALAVGAVALSTGCGVSGVSTATGTGGQVGTTGSGTSGTTATSSSVATTGTSGTGGMASTTSSDASSASASGTTGSTTGTGTGGAGGASSSSGDCTVDADCPGGACVALTPGGYRVCQTPPQKAVVCNQPALDQCCAGMACPNNELCYGGPLVPLCAGIPVPAHNQCAIDQCSQDADCAAGQICGLAGTLGAQIRSCVAAACKVDGDCSARAGGVCAPVSEPCCGVSAGLYCVYPGGGCRRSTDCGPMQYCQLTGTTATCTTGAPVCPQ